MIIKNKLSKKFLLKTISLMSLIIVSTSIMGFGYSIEKQEFNNNDIVKNSKTSKVAPTELKNNYVFQNNYFAPMISSDGIGISLNSSQQIISASTPNGFLNWQVNINSHPTLAVDSHTYKVINGTILKNNLNQEIYMFLALGSNSTATSLELKLVMYNLYGEAITGDGTSLNYTFTNPTSNAAQKVALAFNKKNNRIYIYIPGTISNFRTASGIINFNNTSQTISKINPVFDGWVQNETFAKLNNNNYILGLAIPSESSNSNDGNIYAIINSIQDGKNWLTIGRFHSNFVPQTFDFNLVSNSFVAKTYNSSEESIPLSITVAQFGEANIYNKINPVSYFSSSNNVASYNSFIFTIPGNQPNLAHSIKFFDNSTSSSTPVNQVDRRGRGNAIETDGKGGGPDASNFLYNINSPFEGNVNILLYREKSTSNFYLLKNNFDLWTPNTNNDQSNHLLFKLILEEELKNIVVDNLFIRKTNNDTLLSMYQSTSAGVISSKSVAGINGVSYPTQFESRFNISLPEEYVYFDDDFQQRARNLNWLQGASSQALPSRVSSLITVGNNQSENFFLAKNGTLNSVGIIQTPFISYNNLTPNDRNGTFSSNVVMHYGSIFSQSSFNRIYYDVSLTGLANDTPATSFAPNNNADFSSILPTDITSNNIKQFTVLSNLPAGATETYSFSNQNNLQGTLDVSLTVNKHYLDGGAIVEGNRTFNLNLTGFKKISPTDAKLRANVNVSNLTTHDATVSMAANWVEYSDLPPNSQPVIEITDPKPLTGELNLKITFTRYYDSNGNPVDTSVSGTPLIKNVSVSGFSKVAQTNATERANTNKNMTVYDVTNDSFFDYVSINNRVPNSTVTLGTITNDNGIESGQASVTFTFTISKVYNSLGAIVDGTQQTIKISGFRVGDERLGTRLIRKASDPNIYPWQINDSNISRFLTPANVPSGVKPTYRYENIVNIGNNNTSGSLSVIVSFSSYIPITGGAPITPTEPFTLRMDMGGFRSVTAPTLVSQVQEGKSHLYASDINKDNYINFITISSGTGLNSNRTQVEVGDGDITFNNRNGIATINYRLINYFDSPRGNFVLRSPNKFAIAISGFRTVSGRTEFKVKENISFESILPENFVLDMNNYSDYFQLTNLVTPSNNPNLNQTILEDVKIKSFDNTKGEVRVGLTFKGEYYNENFVPVNLGTGSIEVEQTISGFNKIAPVNPIDQNLPIIIGASVGSFALIILAAIIIAIISKSKKKKEYEKSRQSKIAVSNHKNLKSTPTTPIQRGSIPTQTKPIGINSTTPIQRGSIPTPTKPIDNKKSFKK